MRADEVQPGDVYKDEDGRFMVREVRTASDGKGVALRLSPGRASYGGWYEFPADAEVWVREDRQIEAVTAVLPAWVGR